MTDGPRWLLELEEKARAATQGDWFAGSWSGRCYDAHAHDRDICNYKYTKKPEDPAVSSVDFENMEIVSFGAVGIKNGAHIAANSPDRILALCSLIRDMGETLGFLYHQDPSHRYKGKNMFEAYQRGPSAPGAGRKKNE